jgi:hypothetical protein
MDKNVRAELDELAGHSTGTVLIGVAIAAALIDAGAVKIDAILRMADSLKRLGLGPAPLIALDQFVSLLEATSGSLGHQGNLDFGETQNQVERILRPQKPPASD